MNSENNKKKKTTLREKIQFYLIDCHTIPGKIIDIFILFLNLLLCFIFVAETYPISKNTSTLLWQIEIITIFFLIIEYLARIYGSPNRLKTFFNIYTIIDLLTILPTISILLLPSVSENIVLFKILRIFRIFRAFRIIRFLRFTSNPDFFFGTISIYILKVIRLIITILMIFFITSGIFYHVENEINSNLNTFGDAFYFSVVTLTTVGFGDIVPVSESGRRIVILMIISGIILIPWQASQIIKEWFRLSKLHIICPKCGLQYHDKDASHCKSCGQIIFQKYDGD